MPSKKTHFTLRLQPSVADRVDAIAARFGISRSAVLEKCIEKYLFDVETELFLLEDLDRIIAQYDLSDEDMAVLESMAD